MSSQTQVLIIGGGAAGMMAAITVAEQGREVTLLEGNDRVGKKLLSTGNGKCNFTNEVIDASCYHGDHIEFITQVLDRFSSKDLQAWFAQIGIDSVVRENRVYPRSEQASSVLDALRLRMEALSVNVVTGAKVMSIRERENGLEVQSVKETYQADSVILAAGSAAAPKTGSDGSGYRLAEQMGLMVNKPLPALTNLKLKETYTKSWTGVRCDGSIALKVDGETVGESQGQIQLTAYGISGIPAFEVSRFASRALKDGRAVEAHLSFLPGTQEEAQRSMRERRQVMAPYPVPQFLNGLIPKNLAGVLLRESGCERKKCCSELTDAELDALTKLLTDFTAKITGTGSLEQSQVCTGGVIPEQINAETMACRQLPSLFVAGEILDVDGICGGYNLHWAFATGYLAGLNA